jgi:Fe-S cluster biosynthesis and repair protein YggX
LEENKKYVCVCVCEREREREREKYARMPSKLSKTDWERLNEQDWKIW